MKMSSQLAVLGVGLVLLSSGVIWPIRSDVSGLEAEVLLLDQQSKNDAIVPKLVEQAYERVSEIRLQRTLRAAQLCPDTPEAQQEVETLVLEAVLKSGLRQVRVDTGSVDRGARFPSRPIDLVVEGDATSLKKFLVFARTQPSSLGDEIASFKLVEIEPHSVWARARVRIKSDAGEREETMTLVSIGSAWYFFHPATDEELIWTP